MRERLLALAEKRARLTAQAQSERETLARFAAPVDGAATAAAGLLRAARRAAEEARRHPAFIVAAVAILVVLRPRRAVKWLARGWSAWRLYRGALGWWNRFGAAAASGARSPAGAPFAR